MEDAHSIVLSMEKHPNDGFFGIFDGHCGTAASKYCSQMLYSFMDKVENFDDHQEITNQVIQVDSSFMNEYFGDDGTTAIFCFVEPRETENGMEYKVTACNIGDSRCVLGTNNGYFSFSEDHKPNTPSEQRRIEEAGGHVSLNRVRGNLALSRAFGDRSYKVPVDFAPDKQQVTCIPDYVVKEVKSDDFLFIACDGIYEGDIFTRDSVIEWIKEKLKQTNDTAQIMAELLDECVYRGSRDNMSAMLIQFKDGTEYDQHDQYIPGPFYEGNKHQKFQDAYRIFAEKSGISLEESFKMYEDMEKKKNEKSENGTTNTTNTTV